jgi:flavin-dependent dehydrogenase
MSEIKKITIVGGGSAGWMTAATLIKFFPDKEITVIESSDIPTVGVGESTLGGIRYWMSALDIDEKDFMKHTNASYKLSIKFTDFYDKDYGSFHYPFGNPCTDDTNEGLTDWQVKKALYPETPVEDYCRTYYPSMPFVENNKFPTDWSNLYPFRKDTDVAYHMDAALFGKWLKENYCLPRGVKHIDDKVTDISHTLDQGITSLELDKTGKHSADLYIDCTGWKSLLLGGAMKEPFDSFNDIIPNNKAWATQVQYIDKEKEIEPYTNCTAINNGWVWNIPLWSRLGTGYVYSDKHITPEEALEEFKQHLMSDKMTIPRTREEVEQLTFRPIDMRIGIHKRTWVKNVVAIGLSAGFIEPLESNGLFTVHEFLLMLVSVLQRGHGTQWDRDVYNTATRSLYENFAEFVALHYALSIREDTPYWQDIRNKSFNPAMVKLEPTINKGFAYLANKKMFDFKHDEAGGMHCVATGMNYFVFNILNVLHAKKTYGVDVKETVDQFIKQRDDLINLWETVANSSPILSNYLKENVYNDSENNN